MLISIFNQNLGQSKNWATSESWRINLIRKTHNENILVQLQEKKLLDFLKATLRKQPDIRITPKFV